MMLSVARLPRQYMPASSPILATAKPLRLADNARLKMCHRCGCTYETATNRQPVFALCTDCKDVCQAWERRLYKVESRSAKAVKA